MRGAHVIAGLIVKTTGTSDQDDKMREVMALVTKVRGRFDSGHYNFMSWNGRTRLELKLNEYESYVMEQHRSRSAAVISVQKHKLDEIRTELRQLLGST